MTSRSKELTDVLVRAIDGYLQKHPDLRVSEVVGALDECERLTLSALLKDTTPSLPIDPARRRVG